MNISEVHSNIVELRQWVSEGASDLRFCGLPAICLNHFYDIVPRTHFSQVSANQIMQKYTLKTTRFFTYRQLQVVKQDFSILGFLIYNCNQWKGIIIKCI